MAIRSIKAVPTTDLIGKFICSPSLLLEQEFGFPAVIESTSAAQMVYRRLGRGEWNATEKEWEVAPGVSVDDDGVPLEGSRKCKLTSIKLVCDTVEEAIALYAQATATRKAIDAFRAQAHAALLDQALQGQLPVPAYLQRHAPPA